LETKAGHKGTEVADLFEDAAGTVWFSVNGVGTYRFAEDSLNPYFEEQSCVSHTFNTTFQDQKGRIWFGGWLGLFRYLAPC
jgi:ligand-binding sensor domain-containing protein